jgi:predicted secreted protein
VPGNLKDILSHLSAEIDQETLLKYLNGQLSDEQKHEIEKKMLQNDFTNDAMEGLQEIRNKEKISLLVDQLNHDLRKKLEKKKQRKEKLKIKAQPWLIITVVILLLLIIISYFIIQKLLQHS